MPKFKFKAAGWKVSFSPVEIYLQIREQEKKEKEEKEAVRNAD